MLACVYCVWGSRVCACAWVKFLWPKKDEKIELFPDVQGTIFGRSGHLWIGLRVSRVLACVWTQQLVSRVLRVRGIISCGE